MTDKVSLELSLETVDHLVADWLNLRIKWCEAQESWLTHDEDKEDNLKDKEAMKRVLNFITGEA